MDAVKFLKERKRMCLTYEMCDGCPLQESDVCLDESENAEALVKVVEKWSAEHPQKTRLQDFMEKHPNALTTTKGVPMASPRLMGYCEGKDYDMACLSCEHGKKGLEFCWNLPVEETDQ